ncbi:uncharacterized protein [Maniola hyperantus]|uniref:uncharacterized protein n=1 Tax=Aphantopus hyperantus TaxID=2795564 RepID=UPI00156922CB|nr:uncharacterized protein LOC117984252 [Maniola hyperantus]
MSINDILIIRVSRLLVLMCCVYKSSALLCYNCSATHRVDSPCGGEFAQSSQEFNNSRYYLLNCSGDNAMCFVRSWTARAKHAWIVQRGCYQVSRTDPFPQTMDTPTRAMACKLERLADAEYRVCLCRADWCNTTSVSNDSFEYLQILKNFLYIFSIYVIS